MPELPEVETMVRDLRARVVGRRVVRVEAAFPGSIAWPDFSAFRERLVGRTVTSVSRRGKYAVFPLDSRDLLIIHRGMSGSLLLRRTEAELESYIRVVFHLDDASQLRFQDPRKFGRIYLMAGNGHERALPWTAMGPEPLNGHFTARVLHLSVHRRSAPLKPLLLGQRIVAGLGNIYVDEALYRARLHPLRPAGSISLAEARRLHRSIRSVLTEAIASRGTTFNSYTDIEGRHGGYQQQLRVFQRSGNPCMRCSTPVVRIVVQGRGTHLCPRCQRI